MQFEDRWMSAQHVSHKLLIAIAHPGRQHSHQAALALQNEGLLTRYWSGIPCSDVYDSIIPGFLKGRLLKHGIFPLREELCRWVPIAPLLRKPAEMLLDRKMAKYFEYLGYSQFDRYVARQLRQIDCDAVIAYENSAVNTFREAKRRGMITILDAASFHHQAQDRLHGYVESESLHRKIAVTKDEEINLADYVITVSDLARQTYLDAGIPADKVFSLMIGSDIDLFVPGVDIPRDDYVNFIFCGSIIMRKGVDLLLAACKKIAEEKRMFRMRFIGGPGEATPLLEKNLSNTVTCGGLISQQQLVREYQQADCLILPSLNDSFGMAVTEALACGVPVIVSDMVGAKDLVHEGKNGWVIPVKDVDALVERMTWCIENKVALRQMRSDARASSLEVTWQAYHSRLLHFIKQEVFSDHLEVHDVH